MPATHKQLKARWETEDGKRRLREVVEAASDSGKWPLVLEGFTMVDEVHDGRDLRGANLQGADLYGADFDCADLFGADLSRASLVSASLNRSRLCEARLDEAILHDADLRGANLSKANLKGAELSGANLSGSNLNSARLNEADLRGDDISGADLRQTDLRWAYLTDVKMDGTVLTGVKLYGSARDDWSIKHVRCDHVYWDETGEERTPADREFGLGEFERLYGSLPIIEYVFRNGMNRVDPIVMDRVIQTIRNRSPEFDIRIDSINARGIVPSIRFTVRETGQKDAALQAVVQEYERLGGASRGPGGTIRAGSAKTPEAGGLPVCFISYSWDSEEHRVWVRYLAGCLESNGCIVHLDQKDLRLGTDLTQYMETSIREANCVLLICTPDFARKADRGEGGVGYERMVITGEWLSENDPDTKFIPLLRRGTPKDALPSYLRGKLYADFREDEDFPKNLEALLRSIFCSPRFQQPPPRNIPTVSEVTAALIDLATPTKPREIAIRALVPTTSLKPEPTLDEETYEALLRVVKQCGIEMERHPSTYQGKDEQALRDQFVVTLSTHFESATGETFNRSGKTDILIRHEGKNAFVAECKFWRGVKAYHPAIDQLLGYLTWRDSKAALICFVDSRELMPILGQIGRATPKHSCFVRILARPEEGWFDCEFRLRDDSTRLVRLSVLCFHFPRKTEAKKRHTKSSQRAKTPASGKRRRQRPPSLDELVGVIDEGAEFDIRSIIDTLTSKVVLILGRFTPDRKAVLNAIKSEIRRRNYTPVLFDFDVPASRDITETVSAIAHVSRFVIADLTDAKSVPQELMRIVPSLPSVPVQPLILKGQAEYGMFEHFKRFPWVLPTHEYDDQKQLIADIRKAVIAPAEAKVAELRPPAR